MRLIKWLVALIVLLAVAGGVALYFGYQRVHEPFKGYDAAEVFLDVAPGSSPATISQQLISAGIVRDRVTFRSALWISGQARELKAGEYRFDRAMTPLEVIDKIARGDVHRRLITFREGLTIAEMARVYEEAGFGSAADFMKAATDPAPIRQLDPNAPDLEGYLFPETYTLARETTAAALVAAMVDLFEKALTPPMRATIASRNLTIREAVTLASLVEKETAVAEERPLVAAVYRKRVGMPMQADPTVIYALQRAGRYDGNIRRDDLQFDSPYNTYRNPGLPPGPIASPGRGSLEAVANPADVEYLYFVSRNDGSHVFAKTLDEHNRNVRRWQVEYFRQQRREQ
jgi:UPF0755 protein